MNPQEAYNWLLSHQTETTYLESMRNLLGWDQRTHMPARGHLHRANQLANITRFIHLRRTDPQIGEMLSAVEGTALLDDPCSVEAVNVREWRRSFDRAVKIPEKLAVELARVSSEAESFWRDARPRNDWTGFTKYLQRIVALKREEAELIGYSNEPYDALLDEYEPEETARSLEPLFAELRAGLVDLLGRIEGSSGQPNTSVLHGNFSVYEQESFAREVVECLGYDFAAGRLDPTAHPFSVDIGPGDVRITTRYDSTFLNTALFGAIHEAGHAIYQQGLPSEHWGTPMGQAVSLGIHESQSRLWENFVGRSLSFWKHFYPQAQRHFPTLQNVKVEAFHSAVNEVRSSLIRTEADEVTYNLHILLRFELELAMLRGDLEVEDLPEAWNGKMEAYLGLTPPDFSSGVMQDIHWAIGAIGYFPTYTLGNLYAAQLFAKAEAELGSLQEQMGAGEFRPLLDWLRQNIHSQGSRYLPRDLIRQATGADLNSNHLIEYLETKYAVLYGF
ncbi:MAG: carboxypeptidase M32 [Desulforhabdus sp.]|jgi:carboxypeptidase Taq|nr:carboxypeptidase M32 [Desulforhabdus sp.]